MATTFLFRGKQPEHLGASGTSRVAIRAENPTQHKPDPLVTVGVWDVDADIDTLPELLAKLNGAQSAIHFGEVIAAVPAGMISQPERFYSRVPKQDHKELMRNAMANDFFPHAEKVRRHFRLKQLVAFTSAMVAFIEEGGLHYNYFSVPHDGLTLASVADLDEFAKESGRPFEVAVGTLLAGSVLVQLNPKLEFHEETRGCLFDFNEDRHSITKFLSAPQIDNECKKLMKPKFREAAEQLVAALASYKA